MIANGVYGAYGVPVQNHVEKDRNKEAVVLFKILQMVEKNARVVIPKKGIAIHNNVKVMICLFEIPNRLMQIEITK